MIFIYSDNKNEKHAGLINKIEEMFTNMCKSLYSPSFEITSTSMMDMSIVKNLVVKLYILKKLSNMKVFDAKFLKQNPEMNLNATVIMLINILTHAINRLNEVYSQMNRTKKVNVESSENSQELNSLLNDDLPLLSALI